ncbi:SHOCT domain-containing protein [candidate division WOR-3 bacterium]|nr:SHOCT domain-containing protein [candidate division WOR-3 bacterium]
MWLVYIILVGVIVYLIITSQKKLEGKDETALEILKKRYAKGEITKEEFKKIKKDLED